MSHTTLTLKQNRRRQTPITTIPSLQIGTTHLFNCTNTNLKITDLWTTPVKVGHLLVEWRGQQARMSARWGIPSAGVRRNGCWGRQQQSLVRSPKILGVIMDPLLSFHKHCNYVVVDLPLLRVAVEGSDNPVSLEKPCQASLPPDQQGRHSLGRQPEVQYIA